MGETVPRFRGPELPILALTLGHVFSNAVRTLPAMAADVLSRDLGLTPEALAALTGAFPAAFALAMVPVGVGLDRWGVRRTALVLLAIGGLRLRASPRWRVGRSGCWWRNACSASAAPAR